MTNHLDMTPTEIKVELLRAGVTQIQIASAAGVHKSIVSRVIDGTCVSDRVRRVIADHLETDVKRIWPSTYLIGGGPRKPGRPRSKS